jgi:hypothetical protein
MEQRGVASQLNTVHVVQRHTRVDNARAEETGKQGLVQENTTTSSALRSISVSLMQMDGLSMGPNSKNIVSCQRKKLLIQREPSKTHPASSINY